MVTKTPMKRKQRGRVQSQLFFDGFCDFLESACACSPKLGVEIDARELESGTALLYAPVKTPGSANLAFNPRSGLWQQIEMCATSHMCFCVSYSGSKRFMFPVPEAGEETPQDLPMDTPGAAAEVCEFYHDASSNITLPMNLVQKKVKHIIRCFVKIWINRVPRLLPLDDEGSDAHIPKKMVEYLAAYSGNDFDRVLSLGGASWEMLCKKYARNLALSNHEPITDNDFLWSASGMRAFSTCDRSQIPSSKSFLRSIPEFAVRPSKRTMALLFCSEFFGYTSEGRTALDRCLSKWGSLKELRKNLTKTLVTIPKAMLVQIRYAIELRATRHAAETLVRKRLNRPQPFVAAIPTVRAKLRKLEKF